MTLQESIEALRDRARTAFSREFEAWEVDPEDGGESDEAPSIDLCFSLETGEWQARVSYDGGMGGIALIAGHDRATPEEAVASLSAELDSSIPTTEAAR
jgi:hypothetical protein